MRWATDKEKEQFWIGTLATLLVSVGVVGYTALWIYNPWDTLWWTIFLLSGVLVCFLVDLLPALWVSFVKDRRRRADND